jgi:lactate racemase
MLLQHAKVTLVSGLDEEMTARLFFDYAPDPKTALASALTEYGREATVRVIPFGGNVLPYHTG